MSERYIVQEHKTLGCSIIDTESKNCFEADVADGLTRTSADLIHTALNNNALVLAPLLDCIEEAYKHGVSAKFVAMANEILPGARKE